jgi:hypothetical protein
MEMQKRAGSDLEEQNIVDKLIKISRESFARHRQAYRRKAGWPPHVSKHSFTLAPRSPTELQRSTIMMSPMECPRLTQRASLARFVD